MLTIFRRHATTCAHRAKGRDYLKCSCPLWADGYQNGKRTLRVSLKTRDMARARKRAIDLESTEQKPRKSVAEAIATYRAHCISQGHRPETLKKSRNALNQLQVFLKGRIEDIREVTLDELDAFRSSRKIAQITSAKELEILRQFLQFCTDRRWTDENAARKIKGPRHIKPNDVVPYSSAEMGRLLAACGEIGSAPYERLRARAMILALRYTALRIGDVALLRRERIQKDGERYRIFLRTEKTGNPVFLPVPRELTDALDSLPLPRGAADDCPFFFWSGSGTERNAIGNVDRSLRAVFRRSQVKAAHAHRFRHTLATELLGKGASFEDIADVLGNSPAIVRRHYAKWSPARQARIDELMALVHDRAEYIRPERVN